MTILQKVTAEVAEQEFTRFVEAMDIDADEETFSAEELSDFSRNKRRMTLAIQVGSLVINDVGEAIYTPVKSGDDAPAIHFKERTGADLTAMDRRKKNETVAQGYAVMAAMARVPPSTISKLRGIDIKTCEAIFTLLMA